MDNQRIKICTNLFIVISFIINYNIIILHFIIIFFTFFNLVPFSIHLIILIIYSALFIIVLLKICRLFNIGGDQNKFQSLSLKTHSD